MFKNFVLLLSLWLFAFAAHANMASPYYDGTKVGSPFGSNAISITKEQIFIKIDKDFNTAKFVVTYYINTPISGTQIPLLFVALDYSKDFKVWVDDSLVEIKKLPENFIRQNTFLDNFRNSFPPNENYDDRVEIKWEKEEYEDYSFSDLKYFEADLSKGTHKIKVAYTANAWRDKSDYIIKKSFRYSLTPAKYWKNFGSLHVEVEQEVAEKNYTINFGDGLTKIAALKKSWEFTKLPAEYINISYKKEMPKAAAFVINADPFYLMIVFGLLLFLGNMRLIYGYRKRPVQKITNPFVWFGSIVGCFLILVSYSFFYFFIDYLIGPEASGHMGYSVFMLGIYPILLLIYWGLLFFYDWYLKRKLKLFPTSQLKNKIQV